MNPELVSSVLGGIVSLVVLGLIPIYLMKQKNIREEQRKKEEQLELARIKNQTTNTLSLNDINVAISRERDAAMARLDRVEIEHNNQIEKLKEQNNQDVERLEVKLSKANSRIKELENQVDRLSIRLGNTERRDLP